MRPECLLAPGKAANGHPARKWIVAGQIQAAARGIADDAQQAMRALGTQIDEIQGAAEATQTQTQEAIDRAEDAAADARALPVGDLERVRRPIVLGRGRAGKERDRFARRLYSDALSP
jgi:hypothetical protein